MQGRRGGELLFVPEIEKFAKANRKVARLAKEAERLARIEQENIDTTSISSQELEEEHRWEITHHHHLHLGGL